MSDAMRESFEKVYPVPNGVEYHVNLNCYIAFRIGLDGVTKGWYKQFAYNEKWEIWQAPRAVPIELPDEWDSEGWNDALTEVKSALIAQGYRVK
jgi:hypothetical protein